ncbi:MAG: HU family DNA-binding protein [Oscillospiraceae bacterium]|nr:HU family DNA-binding protein [Oscillospiraceae bacterium]
MIAYRRCRRFVRQTTERRDRIFCASVHYTGGINMNKAELAAAVAEKTGASKKDSEKAVNAVFEAITESLVKGDKVQLVGFGSFELKERAARVGRNPRTKEEIAIPASRVASFKVGKALKDAVAK